MRRATRGSVEYYSGRLAEKDMFGGFKPTKEGEQAFRAAMDARGYLTREKVIELIRRHTTEDPTNPRQPFAKELRLAVIEELGLEEGDMDRIRFYPAVGTPLDVYHGVDGWVEFVPPHGLPNMVTLDVTTDPNKTEHKADVIVHEVPDPTENEKQFLRDVDIYADLIAKRLKISVLAMQQRRKHEQRAAK